MSRKKITIELTRHEAETLRQILANVYIDQLLPDMTAGQHRSTFTISRKLHDAIDPAPTP